ncbi:unnamed protein product, partial [Prunus brigantina]
MQVDSKPFPPPVINMVNAQLRAEYREGRWPAKGKEPLAEPKPVLCSRCKYEIGQLRPLKNKRKAAKPSPPTIKKFGGQYDHWPASRAVFDPLGAQSPSTSVGHKDGAAPRPLKIFKPPVVRDDRWYHAQPGGSAQPLTKTQLRRMHRQVQHARDHSVIDLYGMTLENREIVELALKNAKVEGLVITKGSDSAIKAVYQANREAKAKGMPEYLCQYFTVTSADTIFGLTTEERARVSRLDDYLVARDALAKARQALEEEVEASDPSEIKASADGTPGTARPMVEGHGDPFFGHEAEDDPALGISKEEYEGILGIVEEKTLARGGREVEEEAGGENQQDPKEFSVLGGQTNGLDNDVGEEQLGQRPKTKEELLAVAFNEVIPRGETNKYRHLKPLYISAHVEGVPMSKVFVDCGATVNILPYSLMRKLDKSREDLIPSDVVMSSFVGDKSKTIGVLPLKIIVAHQTRVAASYVVESSVDYNILLGRDWIHQSGCIPSSLFQLLFFWDGQRVSICLADEKPFETNTVQARIYDEDFGWVVLTGHDASGRPTSTTAQKVLELGTENVR